MPPKLFDPDSSKPFALSRSKVELFLDCARCFWLDRRRGVMRPSGPPFNLNSAVDQLLKNAHIDNHNRTHTITPHTINCLWSWSRHCS